MFCNQRKISGQINDVKPRDVEVRIEEYLSYYKKQNGDVKAKKIEIAFFGGSFTGLEESAQEEYLSVAQKYIDKNLVDSIRISTRPDYINEKTLNLLKKYHLETIELGVQSMADDVLLASKRGHTAEDVVNASKLIKEYGFKLGHQIMIGLPESNFEKEIYTAKQSIKLKPDVVRIYPVYVLKESKLWEMLESNIYDEISLKDAVHRVKEVYKEYVKNNINVIRIGLQVTEEINQKNRDIKGPICDNYKERVLSEILRDAIEAKIEKNKNSALNKILNYVSKVDQMTIIVPKDQVNYAVGNNRSNIKYLENKYKVKAKVETKK